MHSSTSPDPILNHKSLVDATIHQLRQLTQLDVQTGWRVRVGDPTGVEGTDPKTWQEWSPAGLNARGHIDWLQGRNVLWVGQVFQIPEALYSYPLTGCILRLALIWWAEQTEIFVKGNLVQVGDLYDCSARIVLSPEVKPGDTIPVALRLVSPGHDSGALVRSHLIYEPSLPDLDPGKVADELAVLQGYLGQFQPQELEHLSAAVIGIDWSQVGNPQAFSQSLDHLHQQLSPWQTWLQERQINWIGHAHLDLAWLWPVAETWDVAERTFQSVLQLQVDFPELIFCHSSPALYEWIELNRPQLFAQIQTQVAQGTWEVAAGLWVEPELNLISGESIARQLLYGQRYTQAKFGRISPTAWLPDSFGFCWQLPQLLKQGGIDYFLTQKLRWNDTTVFPHEVFQWRSPDGTEIFSVMLPPIGEQIDPVKMGTYAQAWEASTGIRDCLWLPGVGDHGGGPTRDMLEVSRQWQQSPLFPKLKPTTAEQFCRKLQSQIQSVPVWEDELYLELHRGCYTSHADQKRYNRDCEGLLYEAELWSAIATLTLNHPYPHTDLEQAWKKVLFNQFHDILPGSSIPQVFVDANRGWEAAKQSASEHLQAALEAITTAITQPTAPTPTSQPVVVFNSLNWQRSELVEVGIPDTHHHWQMTTSTGEELTVQINPQEPAKLWFMAEVPAIGYRLFWLTPEQKVPPENAKPIPNHWILENQFLKVEIDEDTGELKQIYDKVTQRQVLAGPGNQLQFFTDKGQYWDAWNIDPDYEQHLLPSATLESITWLSWEPLQQRLRVQHRFGQSQFCQDYILDIDSPYLKISTTVDWQESQVLLKTAFPLTVTAAVATYEIPCGAIQRPTLPNLHLESREQAKWEVPALHWADLSEAPLCSQGYGVSLLNDCKYGYDAQPSQLRLTLLRSPNWPDPGCDRTQHQFTYAIYPHQGSWQAARTTHRGYELNRPLRVLTLPTAHAEPGRLPPRSQFLTVEAENLILMALKQAEEDPHQWIMRWYECHGESASIPVTHPLHLDHLHPVDLLERSLPELTSPQNQISPWQVVSIAFQGQQQANQGGK
jgi:alpha-mannosidase